MSKLLISIISAAILSGCVSQSAILTNDKGQKHMCSANGFGLIGSVVASSNFDNCKQQAIARGYKE